MKLTMENMPDSRIAYMRRVGPYGPENNILMEQFKAWAKENNLMHDTAVIVGIAWDNAQITPPESCRYDVGIVVDDDYNTPDFVAEARLPGGNYAVFEIEHTAEAVQAAWAAIFPALQEAGYQMDTTRPILERYIPQKIENHLCEICVPVCG